MNFTMVTGMMEWGDGVGERYREVVARCWLRGGRWCVYGSECVGDENRTMLSRIGCPYIPHLKRFFLNLLGQTAVFHIKREQRNKDARRKEQGKKQERKRGQL